jgi:chemotaxis protein methyltransferase CheR
MSGHSDRIDDESLMLFLDELHERTGYDFRNYCVGSMKRRIGRILDSRRFTNFDELKNWVYDNSEYEFVEALSIPTTSMFRDPEVFKIIRRDVLPLVSQLPVLRIWSAGCSTGEEVYSLAIMLEEEELLANSIIYATDVNESFVARAREGIFPMRLMREYTANYLASGGTEDFSAYFSTGYDRIVFNEKLKRQIVFAQHNLVSDSSFNEFGLILCRNVLIYFNGTLQNQVLKLLDGSLSVSGFLALGEKESLRSATIGSDYEQLMRPYKIYRKFR